MSFEMKMASFSMVLRRHSIFAKRYKMTVAVGMSGGIDSSCVAMMLKKQGYDVVGVFMRNWDSSDECGEETCPIGVDLVHMKEVDFIKEYWNEVFTPFLEAYKSKVETPNPDVFCNRYVKFHHFKKYINQKLGISSLATGHYARIINKHGCNGDKSYVLQRGVDDLKDQSYFLSFCTQYQLEDVMFPLGGLTKKQVKAMAAVELQGLSVLKKKESMGICFIGKRSLSEFLSSYMDASPGRFIDAESGLVVGQHEGVEYYTKGQGARIGGLHHKYYVLHKVSGGTGIGSTATAGHSSCSGHLLAQRLQVLQLRENDIVVVRGMRHPLLYSSQLTVASSRLNWIAGGVPEALLRTAKRESESVALQRLVQHKGLNVGGSSQIAFELGLSASNVESARLFRCQYKARYSQPRRPCYAEILHDGDSVAADYRLVVYFDSPERAVTAGQVLVLYDDEECLGGGIIVS